MVKVDLNEIFNSEEIAFAVRVAAVTPENYLSEYKPDEYKKYYADNSSKPIILSPMEFVFIKYIKCPEEVEKCFNLVNKEKELTE